LIANKFRVYKDKFYKFP